MNDLEQDIRTALADDNGGQFYDLDREEGLRDMIAESFRGKKRWMAILVWTESLVFTGLAVVVAVKFFSVDTVKDSILYATLFVVLSLMIALCKIWYWMWMNRNSVLREIKRLELRVLQESRRGEG